MLAPDARAVLLDQLRPPAGFVLDAAVATSFTLDLTAALVPPLAFASFELRGTPDPVAALEAVRSCGERVDVFCQAGQISVPAQASDLVAFLEPMVHEVRRPRPGHLFHPKIWMLRYVGSNGNAIQLRLLCLTRNLTRDHSWDAVLRLDGQIRGGPRAGNRPLADLIRALPDLAITPLPAQRRQRIAGLAEDVRRIEWELPEAVNEVLFHVYGIGGQRPSADFRGYRHLVVAPFLNEAGLATVAPDSAPTAVVSRVEDLDRLTSETATRITPYVISSIAGLDESEDNNDLDDLQVLAGLHAKIYVVERSRLAHVFLGSANATGAAFTGNVEILVELVGGATKLGVETFLGEDAPFRSLLEPYSTSGGAEPDPLDDAKRALEDLIRDLAALPHTVTVMVTTPAAGYTLTVTTKARLPIPDGYRVTLELLTRAGDACELAGGTATKVVFEDVPLPDVTPFLVLRATSPEGLQRGTVVRGQLVNDPPGRLDEVLARQVNTPEKFLRFLALLLGLGNPFLLATLAGTGADEGGYARVGLAPGIFELVVRALANRPDALTDLDRLVRRLQATEAGKQVLPEGFDELWPVIVDAQRQLETIGRR